MASPRTGQRASSFGSVAEDYDRYRPGPPLSAVDWILRSPCGTAADLGAGTGALTRELARARRPGHRPRARRPDARGAESGDRRRSSALRYRAEELPIRAEVLDAALVSSAWHWMDPDRTVAEVGRVLRPGGVLGVIWNGADRSVEWVAALLGTRDPSPGDRRDRGSRHRFELPPQSPFAELDSCDIGWSKPMSRDELVGLAGTYSSMITMAPDERERELDRIRLVTGTVVADDVVEMPMRCRCWRSVRVRSPVPPAPDVGGPSTMAVGRQQEQVQEGEGGGGQHDRSDEPSVGTGRPRCRPGGRPGGRSGERSGAAGRLTGRTSSS